MAATGLWQVVTAPHGRTMHYGTDCDGRMSIAIFDLFGEKPAAIEGDVMRRFMAEYIRAQAIRRIAEKSEEELLGEFIERDVTG